MNKLLLILVFLLTSALILSAVFQNENKKNLKSILFKNLNISSKCLKTDGFNTAYEAIEAIGFKYDTCDNCHPQGAPHFVIKDKDVIQVKSHIREDCDPPVTEKKIDRVRDEICSNKVTGKKGETWTYEWSFKLNSDFIDSQHFTHLHQIKLKGSGTGDPYWYLTASHGKLTAGGKKEENLSKFLDKWVHVIETVTYEHNGKVQVEITDESTGESLLSFNGKADIIGDGVMEPHWGLYRSNQNNQLKDETILIKNLCYTKH